MYQNPDVRRPRYNAMHSQSLPVSEALAQYLSARRSAAAQEALQELNRFVRWIGRDRSVMGLTPQEAATYGEYMSESVGAQDTTARAQIVKDFLNYCYKSSLTTTSLAKHVRVRRAMQRSRSSEKAPEPMDITEEGYQGLSAELVSLRDERVVIAKEISRAAADKDFRENAPLDAAREKQGMLEARIRELEDGLRRARIVDTDPQESALRGERRVKLGSKVRLADPASKEEMTYTLVNASEASPMEFRMSVASPVGRALMDHKVGDEVEVVTPRGNLRYRIEQVD